MDAKPATNILITELAYGPDSYHLSQTDSLQNDASRMFLSYRNLWRTKAGERPLNFVW